MRRNFWEERQIYVSSAYDLKGPELSAKMVEQISPTAVRVVFFVPPSHTIRVTSFIETEAGRREDGSSIRTVATGMKPGRIQLTCSLFLGERNTRGEWNGIWRDLGGTTLSPDLNHVGLWLNERGNTWQIDQALASGLAKSTGNQFCLPLFVNGEGDKVGLELVRRRHPLP